MATVYSIICFGGKDGVSVTVNSTTDRVSLTDHGLHDGFAVCFKSGTLPTVASGAALAVDTAYYVKWISTSTFELYREVGLSTKLDFTSTGSSLLLYSAAWAAMDSEERAVFGSAGSERCYNGIRAARNALYNTTAVTDYDYIVLLDDFCDNLTTSAVVMNFQSVQTVITSLFNGVRTAAFHGGQVGAGAEGSSDGAPNTASWSGGYCVIQNTYFVNGLEFTGDTVIIEGFCGACSLQNISVFRWNTPGLGNVARNCFAIAYGASANVRVGFDGTNADIFTWERNIAIGFVGTSSIGFKLYGYSNKGAKIFNNQAHKNNVGFSIDNVSDNKQGMLHENNISVGNTTNWSTFNATYFKATGYNAGLSTDSPWYKTTDTSVDIATTDFLNYTNNDFRPANTSSPQVDAGVAIIGGSTTDIMDNEVTAYNNGSAEVWDIGAFEAPLGYTRPAQREITVEGFEDGTQVKIFTTTTQDVLDSVTSGTTITYDAGEDGVTVDVTILKDDKIFQRFVGIALTAENYTLTVTQADDQNYVASSGLTYNTNFTYDATVAGGNKYLKVNAATSGRNLYSALKEAFIAEASLENIAFDFEMNGPGGLILKNGAETRGYSTLGTGITNTSLGYLIDDGLTYINTSGTAVAIWPCFTTQGVPSGKQARYQQIDGSGTTNGENTGDVNQLIQAYGNASYGNIDYRSHMVWKVQSPGYDEARFDAVATYGNMEGQGYIIPLVPIANGIADASGITNLTFTDHGNSPVTWNGKDFSITIEDDDDSHSGEEIIQWIRNANNFNRHDLVQLNGTSYKTVRGYLEGDTGATLKGVRVVRSDGTTAHYDFNLFTADDGTTYVPATITAVQATAGANTRFVLYNVTQDAEIDNSLSVSGAYSYEITSEADVDDVLDLHYFKEGYEEGRTRFTWGGVTTTVAIEQSVHADITTLRTALGISDYTTITEFELDVTGAIEVDADDTDGETLKARLVIWYNGILTTEDGARYARGAITVLATNNFRINVDACDLTIENISATYGLQFTDVDRRLWRSDGTAVYASTSAAGSIQNDYSGVPDTVETGVSGLTAQESADLATAASSASAAQTAAERALTVPKFLALK